MTLSAGTAYLDIKPQLAALQSNLTSQIKSSVARSESNLAGRFGSMGKNFGKQLLAGIGVTFAAAGIISFLKSSIDAAKKAEESQLKLDQAFKTFPGLANVSIEALRNYNKELSLKTKFDKDSFAAGEAVLAQFKLTGTQIKQVVPLLADYAAKTGQDLPSAATALGRAFLGNTRALKTIGINFKATGDTAKDFDTIMGLLRQKVGGFAEAEGKTFAGQLEILHNQFDELKKSIGTGLLSALSTLAGFIIKNIIPGFKNFVGLLKDEFGPSFASLVRAGKSLLPTFGDIAKTLGGVFVSALKTVAGVFQVLLPLIGNFAQTVGGKLGNALKTVVALIKPLTPELVILTGVLIGLKVVDEIQQGILAVGLALSSLANAAASAGGPLHLLEGGITAVGNLLNPLTLALTAGLSVLIAHSRAQDEDAQHAQQFADALKQEAAGARGATAALIQQRLAQAGLLHTLIQAGLNIGNIILAIQGDKSAINDLQDAFNHLSGPDKLKLAQIINDLGLGRQVLRDSAVATKQYNTALGALAPTVQKVTRLILGMTDVDFKKWADGARTSLNFIAQGLSQIASDVSSETLSKAIAGAQKQDVAASQAVAKARQNLADFEERLHAKKKVTLSDLQRERSLREALSIAEGKASKAADTLASAERGTSGAARAVLKAFTDQLTAMRSFQSNVLKLVARNAPADLIKQLTDMGAQGAGIIAALANANGKDFNAIIRKWQEAFFAARRFPDAIKIVAAITDQYGQDLAKLNGTLHNFTVTTDGYNQKARATSAALKTVVSDIWSQINALARSGAITDTDAAKKAILLQRLRDLEAKFPALRTQIQGYIDKIGQIKPSKITKFIADTSQAMSAVKALYQEIQRPLINGKLFIGPLPTIRISATPKFTTPSMTVTATNVYLTGKALAGGGSLGANELAIVGEKGPELFAPAVAGTIIPNDMLNVLGGMLRFSNGGLVPGVGSVPAIVHGGEFVLSRDMLKQLESRGRNTEGTTWNVTIQNPVAEPAGESVLYARRYVQALERG